MFSHGNNGGYSTSQQDGGYSSSAQNVDHGFSSSVSQPVQSYQNTTYVTQSSSSFHRRPTYTNNNNGYYTEVQNHVPCCTIL